MTPEDKTEIQAMLDAHDFKAEPWSWKKFFSGFFSGQNYAKSIVIGICFLIVVVIVFSVGSIIASHFKKSAPPTQAVGTNQGIIATKNEDKTGNTYSLFNLFNWK